MSLALKEDFKSSPLPLSQQIASLIREAIRQKDLRAGDKVPPTRKLAQDLNVARGTVTTAVDVLIAEGLLESRTGSGVYVSAEAWMVGEENHQIADNFIALPQNMTQPDVDFPKPSKIDFRPCRPALDLFPLIEWRRCLAASGNTLPDSDYGDPRGSIQLRQSIVDYLRRARGLNATTDQIIITNGAVHAMQLMAELYLNNTSQVIFEDPGYPLARQIFERSGASIIPVSVDDDGIVLEDFPKLASTRAANFVYVTPSHQFPIGSRLSLTRRHALIDWARSHQAIIIEDDYDGEFRFDVPPLAPLAAIANDCVVYCGSFSKTLFPDLRLGFAIAPKPLIDALAAQRLISEYAPNALTQTALARFIDDGHFEKHIHRMRRSYGEKRGQLSKSISEKLEGAEVSGLQSGLHALVDLPDGINAEKLAEQATKAGLLAPPLSRYTTSKINHRNALVLGYADSSLKQIKVGVQLLSELV